MIPCVDSSFDRSFFWRQGWGRVAFSRYVPGGFPCFLLFFDFFVWNTYNFVWNHRLRSENVYFQLSHPQKQTKQWVGLTKGIIREDGGYVWFLFRCRNWNYLKQLVRSTFLPKIIVELYLPKSYWLSLFCFWNLKIRWLGVVVWPSKMAQGIFAGSSC